MPDRTSIAAPPPAYRASDPNPPPPYHNIGNASHSQNNDVNRDAQLPTQPPPTHSNTTRYVSDNESIYPARPVHHNQTHRNTHPSSHAGHRSTIAERVQIEGSVDLIAQLAEAQGHPEWIEAAGFVESFNITNFLRRSSRIKPSDVEAGREQRRSERNRNQASGWSLPKQPYSGYVLIAIILVVAVIGFVAGARNSSNKVSLVQ